MLLKPLRDELNKSSYVLSIRYITWEEARIMYPKPREIEQKIELTPKQRRAKKFELCRKQKWRCANCNCIVIMDWGYWNSCELDHIVPEPAGCKKNDADSNLQVLCRKCNSEKGSKR